MNEPMKLQQAILFFQHKVTEAGVDNPSLDTRLLVAAALGCDRATLIAQPERELSADEVAAIETMITRRCAREPVGRILGRREFWGLNIGLNEATLEPRPDSETLISAVLADTPPSNMALRLLDLGTGSGCLLLALLSEWKTAMGTGIDKAPRAVEQAKLNAHVLGLADRVTFKTGSWLENLDDRYDVVVCNPPYIPSSVIEGLQPEVRLYDPRLALDGGDNGLSPYAEIIAGLSRVINSEAGVFFEVGEGQAPDVASLMRDAGFTAITIRPDYGGIERVVSGRWSH